MSRYYLTFKRQPQTAAMKAERVRNIERIKTATQRLGKEATQELFKFHTRVRIMSGYCVETHRTGPEYWSIAYGILTNTTLSRMVEELEELQKRQKTEEIEEIEELQEVI